MADTPKEPSEFAKAVAKIVEIKVDEAMNQIWSRGRELEAKILHFSSMLRDDKTIVYKTTFDEYFGIVKQRKGEIIKDGN